MWTIMKAEHWKKWCFSPVALEKTLESPLNCKEIKLVNPKENQSWIFIGSIDAETEAPVLWSPDWGVNSSEKSQIPRKIESRRRSEWQWMRRLEGVTDSVNMRPKAWREFRMGTPGVLQSKGLQSRTRLSDLTTYCCMVETNATF